MYVAYFLKTLFLFYPKKIDKNKQIIFFWENKFFFLNLKFLKFFCNLVKSLDATTASKPNFYYIVYDMILIGKWCFAGILILGN